jgi:hypothetical protein
LYETQDYVIPLIWEGDGAHPSPEYSSRGTMYGVSGIPHAQFQGTNDVVGGGTNMLPYYTTAYNGFVNIDSPFEIDLALDIVSNQIELTADVTVTGTVTATDLNKILFMVTYDYGPGYTCSVQRYDELDFALTAIGETETFETTFDIDGDWDMANVHGIAMIQKTDGSTGNYPIHQAAIIGYPISAVAPIEDQIIVFNETVEFDVTEYFQFNGTPIDIDLTVESSDPSIATAVIEDYVLTVTGQQTTGDAIITITGEYEGYVASDVFEVSVISPNTIPVIFHLYDSYGDGWQYGGNVNYIQLGEHYITLESGEEGQYNLFLLPGEYSYTYTAADTYGSENSWTINMEDGTELGSGQGGVNGTYDFTFTLEGPHTGTLSGVASLDGAGDITEVAIAVAGFIIYPDAQGNYTIDLPIGVHSLTATLESYDDYQTDVEITEDETTTLDFEMTETVGSQGIVVAATTLHSNYPNPFNPITNIAYSVKDAGNVTLEVYNLRGQLVKTLVNEVRETGKHTAIWNGTDNSNKSVSSGVYFYKMVSEGNIGRYTSTKKMILMK